MAVIHTDHFSGGSCLSTTSGNSARAGLAEILRDIATDLATVQSAEIVTADAAVTAVANANDLASAQALANDLKAKWNAAVPLINEIKAALNAAGGEDLLTTAA